MKKTLGPVFLVLFLLLSVKTVFAQHQKIIEPYTKNFQYLDSLITADSANAKAYSDYVYILRRGGLYLVRSAIKNNGWTLRVKAQDTIGARPVLFLFKATGQTVNPGRMFYVYGSVVLKNLVMDGIFEPDPTNIAYMQGSLVNQNAAGFSITMDSCMLTNTNGNHVRTDKAPTVVKITNCLFANMGYLGTSNLGAGKALDLRAGSCDSLIMVNNTFVNSQDRIVRHYSSTANIKYMKFDHNTIVNSMSYHGMLSLGKVGKNMQITNNLIYDGFALGNDTDKVRQVEYSDSKEYDVRGNPRMSWVIAEPNDTTAWTITKNFYVVTTASQTWYNKYTANGVTGEGAPLTWKINKRIGADSTKTFTKVTDLTLTAIPKLMTTFMDWYRSPTGANKTKNTTGMTNPWSAAYDYDRRSYTYFTDTLKCTYSSASAAYMGADKGYPAGDLNWFPALHTKWIKGDAIGITDIPGGLPLTYKLDQNYPNPFNPSTNISYSIPKASNVTLVVYNSIGQEVVTLVNNQMQSAGNHKFVWNGKDGSGRLVASGVYFYQLRTNEFTVAKKMLLLK